MSEVEEFKKCIDEKCFRWAVATCMEIKREYWHCFSECLGVHAVSPEMTEDKCHELCLERVPRGYNFSKEAIRECLIV